MAPIQRPLVAFLGPSEKLLQQARNIKVAEKRSKANKDDARSDNTYADDGFITPRIILDSGWFYAVENLGGMEVDEVLESDPQYQTLGERDGGSPDCLCSLEGKMATVGGELE